MSPTFPKVQVLAHQSLQSTVLRSPSRGVNGGDMQALLLDQSLEPPKLLVGCRDQIRCYVHRLHSDVPLSVERFVLKQVPPGWRDHLRGR